MNLSLLEQHGYLLLQALAGLSLLTFIFSIVTIPLLVARLPREYFLQQRPKSTNSRKLTFGAISLLLIRNMIGLLLVLAGVAMLFLPGQGVITIIIGIAVMSFPYKRRLIRILSRPLSVRNSLDWIRKKMNKEPFYW